MTEDKWLENANKNLISYTDQTIGMIFKSENWPKFKVALVEYIKNMDELTEVYNKENKNVL